MIATLVEPEIPLLNGKIKITEESLRKAEFIESGMELSSMHLHYHFIWDLVSSFKKEEITYLEIGCYAGGSASLVASHWKKTKCFSVDIGYHEHLPIGYLKSAEKNVNKFKNPISSFFLIEGDSHSEETINTIKKKIEESETSLDILFIDGDHDYNGVIEDFLNYSVLVNPGGYIIFDDYLDWVYSPRVKHAVDNIVNNIVGEEYEILGTPDDEFNARVSYSLPGGKNNCFVMRKK
jgi:predicted O-methyltransferase YrrM